MTTIGYSLSGLIAVGIIFIGARFLWDPAVAAAGYGIPTSPAPSTKFSGFFAAKGVRDIASGLVVLLLMTNGSPRLLGEFMLLASLIAIGDAVTVLRSGGSRAAAYGIHALTALVLIATGVILIAAAN